MTNEVTDLKKIDKDLFDLVNMETFEDLFDSEGSSDEQKKDKAKKNYACTSEELSARFNGDFF